MIKIELHIEMESKSCGDVLILNDQKKNDTTCYPIEWHLSNALIYFLNMHNRPSFILIFPCFFMSSICDFVIRICLTSTILSPIFTDCVPLVVVVPTIVFLIDLSVAAGAAFPEGPAPEAGLFVGNLVVTGVFFCGALTAGLMGVGITAEEIHI